jgi:hypothetical protein
MGKSKNSKYYNYHLDREYEEGDEFESRGARNRSKEKRFERALRTKNIDDLVSMEDEGLDPEDFDFDMELELQHLIEGRN